MNYFKQETDRLIFRKVVEEDIQHWVKFFENNNLLRFMGIDLSKGKDILARDWILKQLERYETQGLGHLSVIEKESGSLIGMGGILPRTIGDREEYEIAYSLIPAYWGKGYGTEIAIQIKEFGFANKISGRFISIIDKQNTASINVAKKNGMKVLKETEYLGMQVYVFGMEK
ncbi:MAG: ribosomal-protein-alanine N-acetyltransferase [Saprospiraceae bacterium]|jgi:ribosomal-protein-alanine N-acetyltransferase